MCTRRLTAVNDTEKRLLELEKKLTAHIRDNEDALSNIDSDSLTFIPVKAVGREVSLMLEDDVLKVISGKDKYSITITKEEENV